MTISPLRNHIHDAVITDYCDKGLLWDPVLSAYFYHLDPSTFALTRILPPGADSTASNGTSFFYFTGRWGDFQYSDDNPRQWTMPWVGLKRFVSGPEGPAAKQLVRMGLFPDHRHKSFIQWAALVFMALYPCCIRGWRIWVFGILAFVFVVVMVLGTGRLVRRGLRRYRNRFYRKIDTAIPLEDLEVTSDIDLDRVELLPR